MTHPIRPTLPESEHRMRGFLRDRVWRTNYVGRIVQRLMVEYDRRGRALGIPAIEAVAHAGDQPADLGEFCHNGRQRLTCGRCQSLVDVAAGDPARIVPGIDVGDDIDPADVRVTDR